MLAAIRAMLEVERNRLLAELVRDEAMRHDLLDLAPIAKREGERSRPRPLNSKRPRAEQDWRN